MRLKSNGGRLKPTLTTERRLKRRSYTKYLWNSKLNDHQKEAYRFVKDSDMSPQVASIVEKLAGALYPGGKRTDGHWTYQLRGDHDLFVLAFGFMKGNSLNLCQSSSNGPNLILETPKCILS